MTIIAVIVSRKEDRPRSLQERISVLVSTRSPTYFSTRPPRTRYSGTELPRF